MLSQRLCLVFSQVVFTQATYTMTLNINCDTSARGSATVPTPPLVG